MKKGLNKALSVIAKIMEILHWIVVGAYIVIVTFLLIDKSIADDFIAGVGPDLPYYGFEVNALTQTGDTNYFAVVMCFIGGALTFALMALVFRNLNIILRTISGRYKWAKSTSPFQEDVVKRVREIGIFAIATPVIGFIITVIITGVSLANGIQSEASVAFDGVVIGLICFTLAQIFAYGASLEKEVDGLL